MTFSGNALASRLERVRVARLMRREPATDAHLGREPPEFAASSAPSLPGHTCSARPPGPAVVGGGAGVHVFLPGAGARTLLPGAMDCASVRT
jgi:hypothetical protein